MWIKLYWGDVISVLEIDLQKIKQNIQTIKIKLNKNQKFCLVAKANAYGLGDKVIAKFLSEEVDYFAVSSKDEFLRVRQYTTRPILILTPIYENITKLAKLKAEFCVSNFESFKKIFDAAKKNKTLNFKIHIAINSGMNRFGFCDKKMVSYLIKQVEKVQNIVICGVFSHYFEAKNKKIAKSQKDKFVEYVNLFNLNFHKNKILFHICNSYATAYFNDFDMVRVGIFAYDYSHNSAVKLSSKIIDFQFVSKGKSVGYNREFVAKKYTKIAVVAIGYADGIFRNIVKKGYVLIGGEFCKIVAIAMDSIFIDVNNVECNICDEVVLIGKSGNNEIFVCDLAKWCDTISYEILTSISSRVERKYLKG